MADPDPVVSESGAQAQSSPQDMSPDQLKSFVKAAMQAAKKQPVPDDVKKWYAATTKITETDLRIRLR